VPSAREAATGGSQLQAALDAGLDQISADQVVTFVQYTRVALAPDSSVFWVANPATTQSAKGSLHFATDREQNIDETVGRNEFIFSSQQEVTAFNSITPSTMLIGSWPFADGQNLQIAFSRRGRFYEEAKVWHYVGTAVLPAMQSQIIASMDDLPTGPIVSNSVPIWLSSGTFLSGQTLTTIPVYPSFLVPDNLVPPYIVAHVDPDRTEAIGAFPEICWPGTIVPDSGASPLHEVPSSQLTRDEVTLTLYGMNSELAWQYRSSLIALSLTDIFGFSALSAIKDAKRTQVEIAALAQKKTIEIRANYYQGTANAIAYRLILLASIGSFTGNLG
jgi:hypothetical protein